jgi:hypothetical protein
LAIEERSEQQRRVGMWGISYPGFYTSMGVIDAHPGVESGVTAGANRRLVHRRRFSSQRRVFLPHAFNYFSGFGLPRPKPTTKAHAGDSTRHSRRLTLLSRSSFRCPNANTSLKKRECVSGTTS